MPADCEITVPAGVCGVQARYRCATCGKAYCESHQTRRDLSDFVDRCAPCEARAVLASREASRPQREASQFVTSGSAVRALRESAVPRVEIHSVSTTRVKRRFRGWENEDRLDDHAHGWVIGELHWSHIPSGQDATVTENFLTVLVDSDEILPRFAKVVPDSKHGGYRVLGYEGLAGRDPSAVVGAAVRKLLA